MYDAPKLRGHTFSKPPDSFETWWDKVEQIHTLSDGTKRKYVKGYIFKFKFGWSKNWLSEDDYSNIATIYNDTSAIALYPRPDTYPSTSFNILLTNDLNFKFWHDYLEGGGRQGYEGVIEGEALFLTSTATKEW
jgi:hypothetical protein